MSGLLTSWATPVTSVPMAASRDVTASCAWSARGSVMSASAPTCPVTAPVSSRSAVPNARTQLSRPSGARSRYSPEKTPPVAIARSHCPVTRSRSSGWITSPAPGWVASARESPVISVHFRFTKTTRPSESAS